MSDERDFEIYSNKQPGQTYVSKSLEEASFFDPPRRIRLISKVLDIEELHEFADIKGETVLRVTPKQRQEVKAVFYEDSRKIKSLTIQRFEKETDKPNRKTSFTLSVEELEKLLVFIGAIKCVPLNVSGNFRVDDRYLASLLVDEQDRWDFLQDNTELVRQFAQSQITEKDIVALGYRKKQLGLFKTLLSDPDFLELKKTEWKKRGPEAVWQQFFENNPWIFGYGLNYVFNAPLDGRKLEQVVAGHDFSQSGKRVDALMKTKGVVSSLCFVEIKTHQTSLMASCPYRAECWPISGELAGSVSQVQKTVQKAAIQIRTKFEGKDDRGDLSGEIAYLYQPRAYVVIGNLAEFVGDGNWVNEDKFGSFEMFRRNITNPEIITFDELYERAKFIVRHSEGQGEYDDVPEADAFW